MSDSTALSAAVALIGALAAGVTALSRPRLAFGILFLLASLSRVTPETPFGTMRLEMPAIAVTGVVLLAGGRLGTLRGLPRSTVAIALAFGGYLTVLTLSSAFIAPGTAQSLRMCAWLAISMLGGVVAFVLLRPRPLDAVEPLALGGATMGAIGITVAAVFLLVGPDFTVGIQDGAASMPRVYGLAWEANLYASFLVMCTFFAIEAWRGRWPRAGVAMLALTLVGFPLGVTRAAYGGLAMGVLAYAGVRLALHRRPGDMPRLGMASAALLAAGFVASLVLLPSIAERGGSYGLFGPAASPGASATASPPAPGTSASAAAGETPSSTPSPTPSSTPSPTPSSTPSPTPSSTPSPTADPWADNLTFRLERVPIALEDLRHSPLVGFGAESFGQRHPDRVAGPDPDHIAIMAVVVPYESGIIGATALGLGFVVLLASLWRTARRAAHEGDPRVAEVAAAFIASIASVLVAYQLNNAIHMAVNWLVIGAAAALIARRSADVDDSPEP